jgi:hypothetical protein
MTGSSHMHYLALALDLARLAICARCGHPAEEPVACAIDGCEFVACAECERAGHPLVVALAEAEVQP